MLKKLLFSLHIVSGCLVIVHYMTKALFNFGFTQSILFCLKLMVVFTGFYIAMLFFKSLKKKRFYFVIYPISVFTFLFGYIFKGFLGGLLMSVTMYPVIYDSVTYKNNTIYIYTAYTGFLSRCCTYKVLETHCGIFERFLGEFTVEGQSTLVVKHLENNSKFIKLTFEDYVFDEVAKDLILKDKVLTFKK